MSEVAGRIDFYMNQERLEDKDGKPEYRSAPGKLQVVIPIMRGNQMVGIHRGIVHSTKGEICRISSLPEATGHLKRMGVAYSLQLESCAKHCSATVIKAGRKVNLSTEAFKVTIAPRCK